jgi:hypothetical protein
MAINVLTGLMYAAGAMYAANRRAEAGQEAAVAKREEQQAANAITYYGVYPDGTRADGIPNNSPALPAMFAKGYKIDGRQTGTNQVQEIKPNFTSKPVYMDPATNMLGTADRVTTLRSRMPFNQNQETQPAPFGSFASANRFMPLDPTSPENDSRTASRFLQMAESRPDPKKFDVSNLPIVGWTKDDGSYALDEKYMDLQGLVSENDTSTQYMHISPSGEQSEIKNGPGGFATLRKTQIDTGGDLYEINKDGTTKLIAVPESKDDPEYGVDEIRILQNGRYIPFADAPLPVQKAATEGGVLVGTFRDGKLVSDKPYSLKSQQATADNEDVMTEMVQIGPNRIVNVEELSNAEFAKYQQGKYLRALYKNGKQTETFKQPSWYKAEEDDDSAEERVLIPSVEIGPNKYGPQEVAVKDLSPTQMTAYVNGEYKTAMFKNGVQQGKFLKPSDKDSGSGSGSGSGAANKIADNLKFSTISADGDDSITFSIPIDDYSARNAANFGIKEIVKNPDVFEKLMEAKPEQADQWLNVLAQNMVNTYVDMAQKQKPENAPTVLPENFVDTWAAGNFPVIDQYPFLGLREKIQEVVGQVIIRKRQLAGQGDKLVVEDIVEMPTDGGGTTKMRVIAGVEIPRNDDGSPRFKDVVQALINRGFTEGEVASLIRTQQDELGLPVMKEGNKVPLPVDQQDTLLALDTLFNVPIEFTVNKNFPAQNLKKGDTYRGTYYDALKRMVTPDAFAMVDSGSIGTQTEEAIANVFMAMTKDDPRIGMNLIKKIYPVSGTTVEAVLSKKFGASYNDVKQAKAARANAAQDAELSALNMESTFFTMNAQGKRVPLEVNTAVARWVLGVDGGLYLLETASQVLSGNFARTLRGETFTEIDQSQNSIMGAARASFASTGQFVTAPDQLANTDRFRNMGEGERNSAIEEARTARAANAALFNRIISDMSASADEMVDAGDGTKISRRLLATRQYYKFILAYQIAAAIQGGTGGRTISDQDVQNILSAFNFDTLSTPDAELTTIREARRMMTRIKIIDGAYASNNVADVYAAVQYEAMEGRAGDAFRPTVYDIITETAAMLRQQGARDRSTGISTNLGEIQPGSQEEKNILNSFSVFTGNIYLTIDEARQDPDWADYERRMNPTT